MRYPYPQDLRPVVQGHVELFGPVKDLLVTGDVEVQSARYTKNMYPEKALLDFRRRLSDVSARREESDFRVRLDIDVVADRTIRIKNNLADASRQRGVQGPGRRRERDHPRLLRRVRGIRGVLREPVRAEAGHRGFPGPAQEQPPPGRAGGDPEGELQHRRARLRDPRQARGGFLLRSAVEPDGYREPPVVRRDDADASHPGGRALERASGAAGGAAIAIGSIGGVDEKISGAVGLDQFTIETGFSQTTPVVRAEARRQEVVRGPVVRVLLPERGDLLGDLRLRGDPSSRAPVPGGGVAKPLHLRPPGRSAET